jgi:hypothetical protein
MTSGTKRVTLLVVAVGGFMMGSLLMPSSVQGRRAGCNEVCTGNFPGECEHTWLNYFCHDPIVGFIPCGMEEYTCT